jgi:hypothetical protein
MNNIRQDKRNREPEKEQRGGSIDQFFSSEPKNQRKNSGKEAALVNHYPVIRLLLQQTR